MKRQKRLIWLTGLMIGSSTLVAAKSAEEVPASESDSTLKVEISFEARGAYDFNKYYAKPGFSTAAIPMKKGEGKKKRFHFDIPDATLCIKKDWSLPQGEVIKLVLKTELKKELTLDSVYADYRGFRIGKAKTNFCDPDACGLAVGKAVQVRWKGKLHPLVSYAVAIEKAPDFILYPIVGKKERDNKNLQPHNEMPTLSANVRYEKEDLWHIQLSGLLGRLEYYDKKKEKAMYLDQWGLNIGAAYHLAPERTTIKLQGIYGQGLGNYMADLAGLEKEVNTIYLIKGKASKVHKTVDAWGVGIGIKHKWLPKWRSKLSYRAVSMVDSEREPSAYKLGHTASMDLFYHPIEQFKIGAQWLGGVRQNISETSRYANRIQAVIGFEI